VDGAARIAFSANRSTVAFCPLLRHLLNTSMFSLKIDGNGMSERPRSDTQTPISDTQSPFADKQTANSLTQSVFADTPAPISCTQMSFADTRLAISDTQTVGAL